MLDSAPWLALSFRVDPRRPPEARKAAPQEAESRGDISEGPGVDENRKKFDGDGDDDDEDDDPPALLTVGARAKRPLGCC